MGTVPIERAVSMDEFTEAEVMSCEYRRTKKTLVNIYSMTKPFGLKREVRSYNKRLVKHGEDNHGEDVDTNYLRKLFGDQNPDYIEVHVQQDIEYDEFIDGLEKGGQLLNFDTFLFVFLTYQTEDDKLHFKDKFVHPLEIISSLKGIPSLVGKPKVLLIQADLYQIKTTTQAEGDVEDDATEDKPKIMRIPTDSDFITIISTLPGRRSSGGTDEPSLLVSAFGNVLQQNWRSTSDEQLDFLSMTGKINGKFNELFLTKFPKAKAPLLLPLVTSSLRKLLYI